MYLAPSTNFGSLVGVVTLVSILNPMIGLSRSRPLLVVMIITPFAPLVPYIAVAVASLRMEKPSMISGSMALRSPAEISTPSRMIRGDVTPLMVEIPLM